MKEQLLPMKPMSEFFTMVLGIMGLFMILVSYHFAFLELLWVAYTALILHVIFITVALPYLIGTLFFDDLVAQDYKYLICAISLFNALLMWGIGYYLGLAAWYHILIVLEFTPILLIMLDQYVKFWEDKGYAIAYQSHMF